MTVNKRKKSRKIRGKQTYCYGRKSKHRGAGNRSGRGRCGLGKRGHCKKPTMQNLRHKLKLRARTKIGFTRHACVQRDIRPVTLRDIVASLDCYVTEKLVKKEKDLYIVDVRELGFNKVLSKGKVSVKMKVTSDFFSAKAAEKIQAAGGEAISSDAGSAGSDTVASPADAAEAAD